MNFDISQSTAHALDAQDPLASFRDRFHIPKGRKRAQELYFCGNSLGLQPKKVSEVISQELQEWANRGVRGHHDAVRPWVAYHEFLTEGAAKIVGAKPLEVVTMNSLTVNLHLMMVSFYRPNAQRNR